MKNKYLLMTAFCCSFWSFSFAQIGAKVKVDDWKAVQTAQHQQGKWLVGAGPTLLGVTAKAGRFVANRTWLGAQGEVHALFSNRREVGLFARYYLWNGGVLSGFSEVGVSYGHFQEQNLTFFSEGPIHPIYKSAKLNAAFGLEYPLGRIVSLEGVAKFGKLTDANWVQPSLQGSVNIYLGRKAK
jgi:hypothetical protein